MKTNPLKIAVKACAFFVGMSTLLPPAFAGQETHGGNAIACDAGAGGKIELLDYFEARLTSNRVLDLGPDTGNYLDSIHYVLNRLAKVDPVAAKRFQERAEHFADERKFLTPEEMRAVADSNDLVNPSKGCVKQQFAVQIFSPKPGEARYLVNEDLWNRAGSQTLAGLVLHEVILRDAIEWFGQTDSDNTRYYTAQISSNIMDQIEGKDYFDLVKASGFAKDPYCFFSYRMNDFYACFSNGFIAQKGNIRVPPGTHFTTAERISVKALEPAGIEFRDDGTVYQVGGKADGASFAVTPISVEGQSINISAPLVLDEGNQLIEAAVDAGQKLTYDGFRLVTYLNLGFYPNLKIKSGVILDGADQTVAVGTQNLVAANTSVEFFPNGKIKTFSLGAQAAHFTLGENSFDVPANTSITLNEDGNLAEAAQLAPHSMFKVGRAVYELGAVSFFPSGKVSGGRFHPKSWIELPYGKFKTIDSWDNEWFYESGAPEAATLEIKNAIVQIGSDPNVKISGPKSNNYSVFYPDGKLAIMSGVTFSVTYTPSPKCVSVMADLGWKDASSYANAAAIGGYFIFDGNGQYCFYNPAVINTRESIEKLLKDLY